MGVRTATLLLLGALLAPLLLTGCVSDCRPGPLVSARGITQAPTEGGDGEALVTLTVTHGRGGPPLAGAAVVFYWAEQTTADYTDEEIPPEAGDPGEPVQPNATAATPPANRTLALMTGPDGTVRAHLPEDRIIGAVAAKPGYTEEWIGYFPAAASATTELALPLYREQITTRINGTLSPAGASTGAVTGSDRVWDAHEVDLGPDPAGQLARLVDLQAELTWENGPTGFGDLGIGLDAQPGDPHVYEDEDENAGTGSQTETLTMARTDVHAYRLHQMDSLYAGAGSQTAFVAPQGLAYTLDLELTFDRAASDQGGCLYVLPPPESDRSDSPGASTETPWIGGLGVLAALGVTAVVLGRKR